MTAPRLGILMLDTRFPRYPGDVGNPDSFDFPVRYAVVPGATPRAIVEGDCTVWTDRFIAAGRTLVADGCRAIATTCGFLTPLRAELAAALGVPVATSALEAVAAVSRDLPEGRCAGILTISATSLAPAHLAAAGVPAGTPVEGVDRGHFARAILGNRTRLDPVRAEAEMVAGARRLCARHAQVATIVLECTNMPPYAAAIRAATGLPVTSMRDLICDLHAGTAAPA